MDGDQIKGLYIFGVRSEGDDVWVDIYGGEHRVCGSVRFSFPTSAERRDHVRTLRYWEREVVPVDYANRGGTVSLSESRQSLVDD